MTPIQQLKKARQKDIKDAELRAEVQSMLTDHTAARNKELFEKEANENISLLLGIVKEKFPEALGIKKAEPKPPPPPPKKKLSTEKKVQCQQTIKKIQQMLNEREKPPTAKGPRTKKRVSTKVADSIFRGIASPIKEEMTKAKVAGLKTGRLSAARDHIAKGLMELRNGLGGISDENDAFIIRFNNNMTTLIEEIEKVQKAE